MNRKPTIFYGWYIVGVVLVSSIFTAGIRNSFSVFFVDILNEFGWGRGSTALMFSLNVLLFGLMAPVAGSLVNRWNLRRSIPVGVLLVTLSTAGCALATELWHFYLLFGVLMPIGAAFSAGPIFMTTLANWFAKRRGLVMGLGTMGTGLSFLMALFADLLIAWIDWRWSYVILAALVATIVMPAVLLFFHFRPEDKRLKAYGSEVVVDDTRRKLADNSLPSRAAKDWTLSDAVRTKRFWFLVLPNGLYWGLANHIVMPHQVRFAEDIGFATMTAASVPALTGIFFALGMSTGFLSDTFGRERAFTLATAFSVISIVVLLLVKDTSQLWMLYLHAVCFGYGMGLVSPTLVSAVADLFYGRQFGAIFGLFVTGMGVGGAIGPWLSGYIFDVTGSYTSAFTISIVAFLISFLLFWLASPRTASKWATGGRAPLSRKE